MQFTQRERRCSIALVYPLVDKTKHSSLHPSLFSYHSPRMVLQRVERTAAADGETIFFRLHSNKFYG